MRGYWQDTGSMGDEIMNCKPGDLAIRIRCEKDDYIPVGSIVRCIKLYPGRIQVRNKNEVIFYSDNVWAIEWNGKTFSERGYQLGVPDGHLRPILDPGDDAQDETLSWLPVPRNDEVTA